jgi:hypothetical protein
MQLDDPAVANWPATHAVQATALLLEECWPATHGTHADTFPRPAEALALPA